MAGIEGNITYGVGAGEETGQKALQVVKDSSGKSQMWELFGLGRLE